MGYYRSRRHRKYFSSRAAAHVESRRQLTAAFGGIDRDIEQIFFNLPSYKLEALFVRYGKAYGADPETYARATYNLWKFGSRKMSGVVAERLLNLVPPTLEASARFDLVRKLRASHFRKSSNYLSASPQDWREKLMPVIDKVVAAGSAFSLPQPIVDRVKWLADGDAVAAQKLIAAIDQEEAEIRISYLDSEFRRIEALVSAIDKTPTITHKITLPQGDITVTITVPKKSFWSRLFGLS